MTARTVLVTGAAGGMCRGINRVLAEAGHRLVLVDLDQQRVQAAADELADTGARVHAGACDVSDEQAVAELCRWAIAETGGVDALVNAAGILDRRLLLDLDVATFRRTLEVNLVGPFAMIRALAPHLIERGWGRIVNISSIAGVTGYPYPSYAASKAGLSNLTRSLLVDLRGTGVTVNAVCPGVVDTPMVIQEVRDRVAEKVPTGRMIEATEIGSLVEFLLHEDSGSINGANLLIDGGATSVYELFDTRQATGA